MVDNVAATNPFETNKVKFFNTFDIVWEVSVNGGAYQSAGKSNNPIYVCLKGPNPTGSPAPFTPGLPTPFRTVCHVACATDGATTADQAVLNSWSRLSGPANLQGWNEATSSWTRPLHYYKPGTTFVDNPALPTSNLLQDPLGTGQCSTWANLMYDALRLNNARPDYVVVIDNDPDPDVTRFLVKNWTPNAFAGWKTLRFGGPAPDMMPKPQVGGMDSEIYGDFTSADTLRGQNSAPKAPSQKVFNNHQFLRYTPTGGAAVYYDASYGVTYSGELNFQTTAVDGFGDDVGVVLGFWETLVKETPAANNVIFLVNPPAPWVPRY